MSWYLTGFSHEPMCGGDVADVIGDDGEPKTCCLNIKDAKLIAAAGTARARAEAMGYDGRAAVEALPELLEALDEAIKELVCTRNSAWHAAKTDPRWEGVGDILDARIEACRAVQGKAKGGRG